MLNLNVHTLKRHILGWKRFVWCIDQWEYVQPFLF